MQETDLQRLNRCFERSSGTAESSAQALSPVRDAEIMKLSDLKPDAEQALVRQGLELIFQV